MFEIADTANGAHNHIDGLVVPEVGDIADWQKVDDFFTIVVSTSGLEEGSLSMSVIFESGEAKVALSDLRKSTLTAYSSLSA